MLVVLKIPHDLPRGRRLVRGPRRARARGRRWRRGPACSRRSHRVAGTTGSRRRSAPVRLPAPSGRTARARTNGPVRVSAVPAQHNADRVAGFLCAFSFALSGIAIARTPGLLATAAIIVALVAVRMTQTHRTLAAVAVGVGASSVRPRHDRRGPDRQRDLLVSGRGTRGDLARVVRPQRRVRRAAARAVPRQPRGRRPGVASRVRGEDAARRAALLRRSSGCCAADGGAHRSTLVVEDAPAAPPAPAASAGAPPAPTGAVVAEAPPDAELVAGVAAAMSLVKAYRMHGHLNARLDPLGSEPMGDPALDETRLEPPLTPELQARIPARLLRLSVPGETLLDALPRLREVYTGTIAYEIEHISDHAERVWLRQAIESGRFRTELTGGRAPRTAEPARAGRGVRDLPASRVHRSEAVLHRGSRRARSDARRGGRARGARAARTRCSSGSHIAVASTS